MNIRDIRKQLNDSHLGQIVNNSTPGRFVENVSDELSDAANTIGRYAIIAVPAVALIALTGCFGPDEIEYDRFADFNGDGRLDKVYIDYRSKGERTEDRLVSVGLYLSLRNEDGTFSDPEKVFHFAQHPRTLEVRDVNDDGFPDIVYRAFTIGKEPKTKGHRGSFDDRVAIGNGDGTFQPPKIHKHYDERPPGY